MKKILKWIGGLVVLLVVVGIGLAVAANLLFDRKRDRVIKLEVKGVTVGSDEATLARGKYLFASRGCGDCHGADGAGRVFIDEPAAAQGVRSSNITPAGVVAKYTDVDWVRTIRHGVKPDGRTLFIMPSEELQPAHRYRCCRDHRLRTKPPAAAGRGRFLHTAAAGEGLVCRRGRQGRRRANRPRAATGTAGGRSGVGGARQVRRQHVLRMSRAESVRRKDSRSSPDWPAAANLTPGAGSVLPVYDTPQKFKTMFRSGKRPNGMSIAVMPFETLAAMNDTDVEALYVYLKTLPPRPLGER